MVPHELVNNGKLEQSGHWKAGLAEGGGIMNGKKSREQTEIPDKKQGMWPNSTQAHSADPVVPSLTCFADLC